MAKKKTTKKSGNMGLVLKAIVLALGVAAFCMAFLTCVKFVTSDGELVKGFTGFQEMFGYTEEAGKIVTVKTEYLGFSFMAVLTFVLPLVGAVLSLLKNKIVRLVGVCLLVAGAILMFLLPQFAVLATADGNLTLGALVLDVCETSLGIGAILGGLFSALGALVAGYHAVTTK